MGSNSIDFWLKSSRVGWATLFCPPFTHKSGGQKNAAHPT